MPEVGEIKRATEIGWKGFSNYIWTACGCCGKERWVKLRRGIAAYNTCHSCAIKKMNMARRSGEISPGGWKGSWHRTPAGYIKIRLYAGDEFYSMAGSEGYVREHRYVMAQYLGRCLNPKEIVHHLNGIKDDNRIENLSLTVGANHHKAAFETLEERIRKLEETTRNQAIRIRSLELVLERGRNDCTYS